MQIVEIPINKITQDKSIYPRFHVDPDRVILFSELLQCETKFPPLKVVKENGSYILLDGFHRLAAYQKNNKDSADAELCDIPRRHARMASARFNNNSSKPLNRGELRQVIADAYLKDGIDDTDEIARELGCSVQYVRRALKPVRDSAKEKLEDKVKKLTDDGVSQKQIAKKIGISRKLIYNIEKEENKIKGAPNETVSFGAPPENSGLPEDKKNLSSTTTTDIEKNTDKITRPENAGEIFPEEDLLNPAVTKGVGLPDICGNKEPTQLETDTRISLELISQGDSVIKIARKLRRLEQWVRNSALVEMALLYNDQEESIESVVDTKLYNVDRKRAIYVHHLLKCQPRTLPDREAVFTWLENNRPKYKDVMFDEIFEDEMMFCIQQGNKTSPENKPESYPEPWSKLPDNIVHGLNQSVNLIEKLTEMVNQGVVQDKDVLRKLTGFYNRIKVAQNDFKHTVLAVRDRIQ